MDEPRRKVSIEQALNEQLKAIYLAYTDLWGHYQALIDVVGELHSMRPEELETKIQTRFEERSDALIDEGRSRLAMLTGRMPPPPI